jgi:hypothetical protein
VDHLQGKQPLIGVCSACSKRPEGRFFHGKEISGVQAGISTDLWGFDHWRPLHGLATLGCMNTFRDASVGVWCLSWHPWSDDVCFEPLSSVLANNKVAFHGQQKAVLAVLGHHPQDMMALTDEAQSEHHGLSVEATCASFRDCLRLGLMPTSFPVSVDSQERWRWLVEG